MHGDTYSMTWQKGLEVRSDTVLELERNLEVIRRWWWLLLSLALLGGVLAFALTKVLVKQEYQATALVSVAPPPSGPYGLSVTDLLASADAQLIPTVDTARAALRRLPLSLSAAVNPLKLAANTDATATPDNELVKIDVKWTGATAVPTLTNAVALAFVQQERARLEARYRLVHRQLAEEEGRLSALMTRAQGTGAARDWLRSQYADAASKLLQQDTDDRIQASVQEEGLSLAQPATQVRSVGPKAPVNGLLGAALGLIIALIVAFIATDRFETEEREGIRPVLAHAGE